MRCGVGCECLEQIAALLSGGGDQRSDNGEVRGACSERKPPEIFCRNSSSAVALGEIVGERHAQVGQEAEHVRFARAERSSRLWRPAWRWARGRAFVKAGCAYDRPAVRDDGIVAALDQRDHLRPERQVLRACEVHRMAGRRSSAASSRQSPFRSRPALQFAQMVRVAERVQHACHRVVGMPVVVHTMRPPEQQAARLARPIESEQHGRGDMQRLRLAPIRKRSRHMLDGATAPGHARHWRSLEALGAVVTDRAIVAWPAHAEQIGISVARRFSGSNW